jgi:hypothetical protein
LSTDNLRSLLYDSDDSEEITSLLLPESLEKIVDDDEELFDAIQTDFVNTFNQVNLFRKSLSFDGIFG